MPKEFKSLTEFAKHLRKLVEKFPIYEKKSAEFLGQILLKEAKSKIGHLQPNVGTFSRWEDLKESTKRDKERHGYAFNADYNPLYREGDLRDSISVNYFPSKHRIILGSDSWIMVYQEEGTRYIPARSVIGATMYQAPAAINFVMGNMMKDWICGKPLQLKPIFYNLPRQHGSL